MAIEAFSQDNYNDGVPDVLGIDNGLNGSYDGFADTFYFDRDNDGWEDVVALDLDQDGKPEQVTVDTNYDHRFDVTIRDSDEDGLPDTGTDLVIKSDGYGGPLIPNNPFAGIGVKPWLTY
ncbi:hypothetical protein [Arthrobacter globiformis]|uniref:hypothetical protein n=1 Tax=Arthrobacter globiformis TaxID=1665 RepID=UPI002793F3D8|nr:hypothetical protein [Arthrobacter globiformis]MDQ0616769.1 hypothetical protein [Arthrobacter globiformis]